MWSLFFGTFPLAQQGNHVHIPGRQFSGGPENGPTGKGLNFSRTACEKVGKTKLTSKGPVAVS